MRTSTISYYDSSTITHVAYNFTTKQLTVHFKHATYIYDEVTLEDFLAFESAESQGKALNTFIKGKYEFNKVEPVGSLLDELPPVDYQMGN